MLFQSSKLKARKSLFTETWQKRRSSFQKCHPKWDWLYFQFQLNAEVGGGMVHRLQILIINIVQKHFTQKAFQYDLLVMCHTDLESISKRLKPGNERPLLKVIGILRDRHREFEYMSLSQKRDLQP